MTMASPCLMDFHSFLTGEFPPVVLRGLCQFIFPLFPLILMVIHASYLNIHIIHFFKQLLVVGKGCSK